MRFGELLCLQLFFIFETFSENSLYCGACATLYGRFDDAFTMHWSLAILDLSRTRCWKTKKTEAMTNLWPVSHVICSLLWNHSIANTQTVNTVFHRSKIVRSFYSNELIWFVPKSSQLQNNNFFDFIPTSHSRRHTFHSMRWLTARGLLFLTFLPHCIDYTNTNVQGEQNRNRKHIHSDS